MKPAEAAISKRNNVIGTRHHDAVEVTGKRTYNSKTFRLPTGEMHVTQTGGVMHFDRGNGLEEIDLSWKRTKDGWRSEDAAPIITAFTDHVGWRHESRTGWWAEIELLTVDGNAPVVKPPTPDDDKLHYRNVATGVDIMVQLLCDGAEAFKTLMRPAELVWRITTSPDFTGSINTTPKGVDADGNNLEVKSSWDGELLTERWTGRVSRISNENTRRKAWYDDPVLPVTVDASINEHITTGADDGFEYNATWINSWSELRVGTYAVTSTNRYNAGLRFQTINVPAGATVSAATLTLYFSGYVSGSATAKLYADDVDDAAAWSASNKPSGITKTTASATITPPSVGSHSFNILAVVQEVLGRGGWASGNDIRFGLFRQGSFQRLAFEAIERPGTNEAQLDITYTTGGGGGFNVAWARNANSILRVM